MKSFRLVAFGADLEPAITKTPEPEGAEVLVRVKLCGVCHSDVHLWQGYFDLGGGKRLTLADRGIALPQVLGHEPVGEVVALGPEAEGIAVGETRLVFPWIGCGVCARCREGNENDCTSMRSLGVFRPGGYAEYLIVPHPRYLLDVAGISEANACTLACAGVTAFNALSKVHPLAAGDRIAIIGMGGLGLTGLALSRALLDREVIAVDVEPAKLEAARQAGAAHAVNGRSADAVKTIKEITGGGAGAVVDFVGSPDTARLGIEAARKGGKYVVVGLYGGEITLSLPHFPLRDLTVRGSYTGTLAQARELIDLVRRKKIDTVPVELRPLDGVTQALKDLRDGRVAGRIALRA